MTLSVGPAPSAPLPIPPPDIVAAAAHYADVLATIAGTHSAGAPWSVIDSMLPRLHAAAVTWSIRAAAWHALDRSDASRRGSVIADSALASAIRLGAKGS